MVTCSFAAERILLTQKVQNEKTSEIVTEPLDIEILRALQVDARSSYRDIARKLKISVGTVHSRVKKLEEARVIRGFSVDIDYSKLGYDITALILLQAKGKHLRDVETKLSRIANVCLVYDITGDFDIALVGQILHFKPDGQIHQGSTSDGFCRTRGDQHRPEQRKGKLQHSHLSKLTRATSQTPQKRRPLSRDRQSR